MRMRTLPRSDMLPLSFSAENILSAAVTRRSKSCLNSFSTVLRSGSRLAQNSSIHACASESLLSWAKAFFSLSVITNPAGPFGKSLNVCESCAPATEANNPAANAKGTKARRMTFSSFPPRGSRRRAPYITPLVQRRNLGRKQLTVLPHPTAQLTADSQQSTCPPKRHPRARAWLLARCV